MAGLEILIKLILRRDRVKLPIWIFGLTLSLLAMIPMLRDIYGDHESLASLHTVLANNPAARFMTGPMDQPTFGALMTIETLLWWGIAVAFLNTLFIVRHTRHNEEIGAQELILSGQVHRSSSLTAALATAFDINLLITLILGFGMQLTSPGWASSQSWLFAASIGAFGFVWASVAAVVAQLTESGRSANGMLIGLIGASFILRGIGDFLSHMNSDGISQPAWISNLSPFGWLQATRPLTDPDWRPLLLSFSFSLVAIAVAYLLLSRRDVGAGLLPSRKGSIRASRMLSSPIGLTWHLQKNIFSGWLIGVLVTVATIGVLVPEMDEMYNSSDSMRQVIEAIGGAGALIPSFMSAMIAITCLIVAGYTIHGLSRLRSEESSGHLEHLLATKLPRIRWLSLHVLIVLIGSIFMLAMTGFILSLFVNNLSDFKVNTWEYTLAGLSYSPIILALTSLYLVLFGLLPKLANGVTWLYFGFIAFMSWLGPIIQLDERIMNLSIMEHIASPPAESIKWLPLLVITTGSIALVTIGLATWRQRSLVEK